jgi:hypothetical protein
VRDEAVPWLGEPPAESDGDLRWRARAFGGEALGGAALRAGAALWGGALGVAAPLSGRLPSRVVLLLVVMTSPEESARRMGLDNLRWK